MDPAPALRRLLALLDVALLLALVVMPLSWFYDPLAVRTDYFRLSVAWGLKPILAPLLLLAARNLLLRHVRQSDPAARGPASSAFFKKACLAWLMPFFTLLCLDLAARALGVAPVSDTPIVVTGQEHLDTHVEDNRVVRDPELLFAFNPNINWDGFPINRHGFRTRDFEPQKPAGVRRVISLGDSCTAQGKPPYSDRLHLMLQDNPPTDQPWEAFNMGVFGYSLMQGYRQFLKYGPRFSPDVVTIYFGWNDHWLYEKTDHQRMALRVNPFAAATLRGVRSKRIYALLARAVQRHAAPKGPDGKTPRVPLPDYRLTLEALIDFIRQQGAPPLGRPAPRRARTPPPVKTGHARSPEEAEILHDEYVEATRQTARKANATLLDLAAIFAGPENDPLFSHDGIHFTEDGLQRIASEIDALLRAMVRDGQIPAAR